MIEGLELASLGARCADDKQAEDVVVLDLHGISSITDYFVICTGTSQPHLRAIRNEIADRLRDQHEMRAQSAEGQAESKWMVLDFGDVIFHVFHQEMRSLYALEDLWSDAPRVEWQESAAEQNVGK